MTLIVTRKDGKLSSYLHVYGMAEQEFDSIIVEYQTNYGQTEVVQNVLKVEVIL